MLAPILLMVSILTIAGYFQLFAEPYVMTKAVLCRARSASSPHVRRSFKWWNLGSASAVAFILFLVIFGITALQLRYTRQGAWT
jgi:multiple sugar transport system permease protein